MYCFSEMNDHQPKTYTYSFFRQRIIFIIMVYADFEKEIFENVSEMWFCKLMELYNNHAFVLLFHCFIDYNSLVIKAT